MNGVEKIEHSGGLIALIIREDASSEGVEFLTSDDSPFQVGVLTYAKGSTVKPHIHKPKPRVIKITQEVLYVQKGEVELELYDKTGKKIHACTLSKGDTVLLAAGGHGLRMLDDSKIIEVKQGPYLPDEKEYLV